MHHPVFNSHMSALTFTLLVTVCGWSLVASDSSDGTATGTADIPPEGAPVFWSLPPAHLQNYRAGPDQETLNYLLPRLTAKFRPNDDWMGPNNDPRFYVLSELGRQENNYNQDNGDLLATGNDNDHMTKRDNKSRRNGPSLSIVQPLDVLRQRMLIEIARRKALQQMQQVKANREWLESVGKRSGFVPNRQTQSRNGLQYDTL